MARKASGKKAWGFSDRSGRRYRLNEMRKEWTGVKVGPDEFEEKHPQLTRRSHGGDAEALNDPRPPIEQENIKLEILGFDTVNLNYREPVTATGQVGRVTLGGDATPAEYVYFNIFNIELQSGLGTITAATNTYFPEGFEATMSVSAVSTESTEVNITGVSATGYPKTGNLQVAFSVPGQVTVAGFGITTNQGTITITPSEIHTPTGVSGTVGQGTVTVAAELNVSPQITGVDATTADRALVPYRDIEDDTDSNYLVAGQNTSYMHTWTGQSGTLQGNSASGFEVASFGKGYVNSSGVNVNTSGYPNTRLVNGMPEISFRITNKTGLGIQLSNNTRCEIEFTLGNSPDGDIDANQHGSTVSWKWPTGINDVYLSQSYGLRTYNVVDYDSGGGGSGDTFYDDDGGDYTTDVPNSVNVPNFPVTWEDDKHTYLHLRLGALSDPSYTSPADSMINLPIIITRMTVMFDDPAANWTATTPASQGFRVDFSTPASGGVGTTTVDITNPLVLTGVEAVATMNDPWDERTTNGQRGIGFDSLSGYSSSDYSANRWGTSNTVDRYSWYVAVSSTQSFAITAADSSQYTVVSDQSNTTYYNPEIHHHKGNLYEYDVSDSSMASHPLYISPWANAANSNYRNHGENWTSDLYDTGAIGWMEAYTVVRSAGISSDGYPFSVNDSGYLVSAVDDSRIAANHYGSAGAKVESKAAHRDDTNDKTRIGVRTQFMSCRFHSAMNITIHMFPYCEWPERGSVPNDTTHWESQTPTLLETDYTYNDGLFGGAAQNNWQYRPATWRRDDLEAFRGEGSQA